MSQPDRPFFLILDVGHGNCAILFDTEGVSVIDAPDVKTHIDALRQHGVDAVTSILASHADGDHISGLIKVLAEYPVKLVCVNPDGTKAGSRAWKKLRSAMKDARCRERPPRRLTDPPAPSPPHYLPLTLEQSRTDSLRCGAVSVEVLNPCYEDVMQGPGNKSDAGKTQTTNTLSAALRYSYEGRPRVLLAGDIDEIALERMLHDREDSTADVLVFPHHGGRPGSADAVEFTRKLCDAVAPKYVIFSIGRHQYENPRPEVVEGVRRSQSQPRIACTQLSPHCHPKHMPVPGPEDRLAGFPARGREQMACCAGTLKIVMNGETRITEPCLEAHRTFVQSLKEPLCLREVNPAANPPTTPAAPK
jgi:competence protein ComEC